MYAQVLLPLRLPFEPTYMSPFDLAVGDYVEVPLAGRLYAGVVTAVDVAAQKPDSVRPIERRLPEIPSETPSTMAFWRRMADYYLCTLGEVFKAARPASRLDDLVKDEERKRKKSSDDAFKRQVELSRLIDRRLALEMREIRKEQQLEKAKESTRERYEAELQRIRDDIGAVVDKMNALKVTMRTIAEETDAMTEGPVVLESAPFAGMATGAVYEALVGSSMPVLWEGALPEARTVTYADLAYRMLLDGKSTLILYPETYRTEKMQDALRMRLPDVLLSESGGTAARTRSLLRRIADGRPYVMAGTRSALLLPHRNLGLIIVDGEEDPSYKQESPAPRYNARDMAVLLGSMEGARVLLSSPAPSLESVLNVDAGKYQHVVEMDGGRRCLVVDTVKERRKRGMADGISRKLLKELNEAVAAGRQGVVMVPGKGYAPLLKCSGCGELQTCPDCGGYLSMRKNEGLNTYSAWCGHCGKTVPVTGRCPSCGAPLVPAGAGLQRVVEIVRAFYPGLRVESIDGDMPEKGQGDILQAFSERRIDILVGTQVVRKAFVSDNIGCIGVLEAERWLYDEGFRADEHGFQLFARLREMTVFGGILVLQTKDADKPVFTGLDSESYREDDEEEAVPLSRRLLDERMAAGYPPFTRMVDIRVDDANGNRLEYLSKELAAAFPAGLRFQGPFKKAGVKEENRMHIEVILPKGRDLSGRKAALKAAVEAFEKNRKYTGHVSVDVDPV